MKVGFFTGNLGLKGAGVSMYMRQLLHQIPFYCKDLTVIHHQSGNYFQNTNNIIPWYPRHLPYNTVLWSQILRCQKSVLNSFDILHNPAQFPLTINQDKNLIMTIHDITPLLFPEYHTKYRRIYTNLFVINEIKKSKKIIAVSHATKNDLIKYLKIPEKKISVIYSSADEIFTKTSKERMHDVLIKYGITKPYLLFIGTIEPRKNIPTILRALYRIKKVVPNLILVIGGMKGWQYSNVFAVTQELKLTKSVVFLNYIPEVDLPALYSGAEIFVYPSLYEGFGIPILEAMQCGTPVITSNVSSLPEVAGKNGILIDPLDDLCMSKWINNLMNNEDLKRTVVKNGYYQSSKFSWKKTAEQTYNVYNDVYNMLL